MMYDFEAATGIPQENVEQIARDRAKITVVCGCGAPAGDQEMCEEPS